MPFDPQAFASLRPYLFHLTARSNVARIRIGRRLYSMVVLARKGGRSDLLDVRRREHVRVAVEGKVVHIRDQVPLHERNMLLENGWTFARFVRHLNERVFFWPGGASGPIAYGLRHFGRYAQERPALLRVPTEELFAANPEAQLLYCRYNSGSPRWSRGMPSPRGSSTFLPATKAPFTAASVVEVAIIGTVRLPRRTQQSGNPGGPWRRL